MPSLDSARAELLALAQQVAALRRGGQVDSREILIAKVADEQDELAAAVANGADGLDILAEAADVFYQAVKVTALDGKMDEDGLAYDEAVLLGLAFIAGRYGYTSADIIAAALAKMRLRAATGMKDHDAEREAIREAVG
jgi:phosphoribosyl-ATP pyrophosphohydrolase